MRGFIPAVAIATLLTACSGEPAPTAAAPNMTQGTVAITSGPAAPNRSPVGQSTPAPLESETLAERLAAIDQAVSRWRTAADLASAHRAAEEARNLVVGPAGPFYGDGNRDGAIAGASAAGLLPGLKGEAGLALGIAPRCVRRDVLGGDWSDPGRRWAILKTAIANWKPVRNTFPSLPSHPQRIVGWATLALAADRLATVQDYGRHAQIHADVSRRALRGCGG